MRAVVIKAHGGSEQVVVGEVPRPSPGPGQALIRVAASALNYHDIFTRNGMPGIKVPLPIIPGIDIAGEIFELGAGVEGWTAGQRVLVDPVDREGSAGLIGETSDGGLAEYCVVPAKQLIALPAGVDPVEAAALPVAYGTAHRLMMTHGRIQAGERVLILGASGGVGTCCILLAKAAGAEVVACASSPEKLARLRELGADHVIDYAQEDFVRVVHAWFGKPHRRTYGGGVDAIVNFTGGDTWARSLRCLRRGGRMLTCGATAGYDPQTDIRYIYTFELQIQGSNGWQRKDLEDLLGMVAAGRLSPVIDDVLPLERAAEGLARLEQRQVFGKVVVRP